MLNRYTVTQSVGKGQYFVFEDDKIIDVLYSREAAMEIVKYHTSLLPKQNQPNHL